MSTIKKYNKNWRNFYKIKIKTFNDLEKNLVKSNLINSCVFIFCQFFQFCKLILKNEELLLCMI